MTKHLRNGLFGGLLAGVAAVALTASAEAANWRGWNIHPEGYPNTVALEQFAKDVTDKTDGRVTAEVYNNGVLGDQPDAIDQVRNGALDFANFNLGPMGEFVPSINVLSLPFLFTGIDQMHAVMDGKIGQRLSDDLSEQGIVALSWFDSGARSFYNTKHPIETPADLDGLKIRVMNNQLYVNMVDEMGGNATPMAYGEVYQSLKTGVDRRGREQLSVVRVIEPLRGREILLADPAPDHSGMHLRRQDQLGRAVAR